jgi:hypothetical protein
VRLLITACLLLLSGLAFDCALFFRNAAGVERSTVALAANLRFDEIQIAAQEELILDLDARVTELEDRCGPE